jgi:hypothetical protein
MTRWLLRPLLFLLCVAASDVTRSPFGALLPRHLVAFYPLLTDSRDYAPGGTPDGYSQDGDSRNNSLPITSKLGMRLQQGEGVDFPVAIHRRSFPALTIGAWVQAGQAMTVNRGCGQFE